jgi:hypothetical protein
MSDLCGALDPDHEDIRCEEKLGRAHRDHHCTVPGFPPEHHAWNNDDFVQPATEAPLPGDPRGRRQLKASRDKVHDDIKGHVEGIRRRNASMRQVDAAADPDWKDKARSALRSIPIGQAFTTDDIWDRLDVVGIKYPREPRAMGPVIQQASRAGLIERTGTMLESVRPECHGRPVTEWRRLAR